jgi:hypothetical protein
MRAFPELNEQHGYIAVAGTRVPSVVGDVARFARKRGGSIVTSNSGHGVSAESRFELTAMIGLPRPLVWVFSAAAIAALELMSSATTLAAPARAAARARIPDPIPTSATHFPTKSVPDKKSAKNSLVRKYRG